MALRAFLINSNLAEYTDEEFSFVQTILFSEGVLNQVGVNVDFEVSESSPAAMSVDVNLGKALVEYEKNSVTWKVCVDNNAVITKIIAANTSGSNRVDAVILHVKQDENNSLKNNVGEVLVVRGTGVSALSDGDIDTEIGDGNWIRLANVTVPNAAVSILTANIADTREVVELNYLPSEGSSNYVTLGPENQSIDGIKEFLNFPVLPGSPVPSGLEAVHADYVENQILSFSADLGLSASGIAGEAIDGSTTAQLVCFRGNNCKRIINSSVAGTAFSFTALTSNLKETGNTDATYARGDSFVTPDDGETSITLDYLICFVDKVGAVADNIFVEIHGDNGGEPDTSAPLATSNVVAGSSLDSNVQAVTFTFASPPSLAPNTTYWWTFWRSGAVDAGAYYNLSTSLSSTHAVYLLSGGTWSIAGGTNGRILSHIVLSVGYGNVIAKFDADSMYRGNLIGITTENVAATDPVNYLLRGVLNSNISGLVPGDDYYGSATAGEITNTVPAHVTAGIIRVKIGKALSETSLNLMLDQLKYSYVLIGSISVGDSTGAVFTVPCGVKPFRARLTWIGDESAVGESIHFGNKEVLTPMTYLLTAGVIAGGTSKVGMTLNTSHSQQVAHPYISAVHDNAVEITVPGNTTTANKWEQLALEVWS